jgi:hypothetical protein
LAGIGLAIMLMAGVVVFTAGPASAHHAEISFTVACGHTVSWTATSWAPGAEDGSGSNDSVTVEYQVDGGGWQVAGTGAFTVGQPSFGGSFTAPDTATSVAMRVTASGPWGNGAASDPATVEAAAQSFPTDCGGSPNPVHAIEVCAEGGIAVTLTNPGGTEAADFTVNGTPYTVEPDQQVVHVVPVAEDGTVQVTVTAEGQTIFDQAVTRDCEEAPPPTTSPPTTTPPTDPPARTPPATAAPPTPLPQPNIPVVPATPTVAPAAPAPLAFTGPVMPGLLPLGLALLTAGGILSAVSRRPRRA